MGYEWEEVSSIRITWGHSVLPHSLWRLITIAADTRTAPGGGDARTAPGGGDARQTCTGQHPHLPELDQRFRLGQSPSASQSRIQSPQHVTT